MVRKVVGRRPFVEAGSTDRVSLPPLRSGRAFSARKVLTERKRKVAAETDSRDGTALAVVGFLLKSRVPS